MTGTMPGPHRPPAVPAPPRRGRRLAPVLLGTALGAAGLGGLAQTTRPVPAGPALESLGVNAVRRLAGVPTVRLRTDWVAECAAHATYLVRADRAEHRQDPQSPHRSALGERCASGHYYVTSRPDAGSARAMAYWATGAFHLPQLIDPRLKAVALGVAHDAAGGVQSAVVLDVRRGLSGAGRYPVRFPAPNLTSPFVQAAQFEWPDPVAGCPGYAAPVGAPVALLLGPGREARWAAIKVNGRAVAACLLTAGRYRGVSDADSRVGRNVLAAQGGAVLLPRVPLPAGAAVRVSFGTKQGRVSWAFRVAGGGRD